MHQEMIDWVKDIAKRSGYSYGSRRMKKALNVLGYPVSRNKARKLMREANVRARQRKKFKVTTNSNHQHPLFDNLLQRQFAMSQPDSGLCFGHHLYLDPGRLVVPGGGD